MKKDSFEKKLAAYVAMATAYLAAQPVEANAQILYTDVNPDAILQDSSMFLDLNNDGVTDFTIQNIDSITTIGNNSVGSRYGTAYANAICAGSNELVSGNGQCLNKMAPVPAGVGINGQLAFTNNQLLRSNVMWQWWSGIYFSGDVNYGGCAQQFPFFVGVKVIKNGQPYYGWIRLSVQGYHNKIFVYDYAIKLTPNSGIQAGVVPTCPMPTNWGISNLTNHSAKLNWNTQSQAIGYTVQYRKAGTTGWLLQYVTTNVGYKNISGLLANTSYEWRVRTICHQNPLVQSQFTAIQTFTTPLRLEDETIDASVTETQNELFIYPNPATNEIHLLIGEGGDYELKIFNILGQQVAVEKINLQQDESVTVSTSNLPSGTYQILVTSNEGNFVGRFVKE